MESKSQPQQQRNPFTVIHNDKRTWVRCRQQMCELCEDTFANSQEDLKTCRRLQCGGGGGGGDQASDDSDSGSDDDEDEED